MLTTIEELEKEIEQFHKNIHQSNELMKILSSVVDTSKAQTDFFEKKTTELYSEIEKLSPEMHKYFKNETADFTREINTAYKNYYEAVNRVAEQHFEEQKKQQDSILEKIEQYSVQIEVTKTSIENFSNFFEQKLNAVQNENQMSLQQIQEVYANTLKTANDTFEKNIAGILHQLGLLPTVFAEKMETVQKGYAESLNTSNVEFKAAVQNVREELKMMPHSMSENADRQYKEFLNQFENTAKEREANLLKVENRLHEYEQNMESKYVSLAEKIENAKMEQVYVYCQEMNKAINGKINLVLVGTIIVAIVSALSCFIK